ncbi:MAG: hypothetical protein JXA82_03065, partial [Sedimentisphaerales bacterium]|nr:hypothetical protein [Sedimentisphaerales bacterium]
MRLQKEETMLHELRPSPGLLVLWAFSKCLFPAIGLSLAAGFVGFLWYGIAHETFKNEHETARVLGSVLNGVTVGGMFGLVMLVLFLVYSVFLFHTY